MGNAMFMTCIRPQHSTVTLISYGGATRVLTGKHIAGEIMFESPDHVLCHADSFYIGHPIPSLSMDDELITGNTYFLLPLDCIGTQNVISASTLAALGSDPNSSRAGSRVSFKGNPFEYLKGSDGRVLIKVVPEFITRLISRGNYVKNDGGSNADENYGTLCSTPELQKHYNQLVAPKDQLWSPKLETISEYKKIRLSPYRLFIGSIEWKKHKELVEG